MKTLVIYYSYGGNTKRIAEKIHSIVGGDIKEIETVVPYSTDYNTVVDQGQDEVNKGYMPKIKNLDLNLDEYDKIVIGTPVWWYTFAPAVKTFLNNYSLENKTIYPFATNGGWIGHTFKDFVKACPLSEVKKGINIRFDEQTLKTSMTEIENWAKKIIE